MIKINKAFKAAVLFEQKKKLKVIDIKLPDQLVKGQLVIKVIKAAICGAQIGEIKGIKGHDKWLPHCMGHEGYGIVIDKHKSVKKVEINDYVIMHWRKGSGINAAVPQYKSNYGIINAGQVTTFQEYAVVSENRVTKVKKIKKNLEFLAPLLGCAISTSWGILNNELNINKKSKNLIFGAGGVGTTIALLLKILCSDTTIIIDRHQRKSSYMKKIGLNFLNIKRIKKLKNYLFDNVIDTTGNTKVISLGFGLLGRNGKLMLVGQPKKNTSLIIKDPLRLFNPPNENIKILSSDGGNFNPDKHMKFIYKILNENVFKFKKIVTHTIKLNQINEGIDYINKGKAIRVVVNI
jgi:S-(hydroxymethyl)glutathione dehydrogenase/alcohol dehydrogenase